VTPYMRTLCNGLMKHLLGAPEWVMSKGSVEAYNENGLDIPTPAPGAEWRTSTYEYKPGEQVLVIHDPNAFFASIPGEAGELLLQIYTAHLMGSDESCP